MLRRLLATLVLSLPVGGALATGLNWPPDRLLPAFATPATTIDCIDITGADGAEVNLFASLEGIVNRTQPRIACVTDKSGEGEFTWLDLHHLPYKMIDSYAAVAKYRDSVTGLVVTDPKESATVNLATTIAGVNDELICMPSLLATLTNAPYSLPVKDDLRGRFSSRDEVYQYLYDHYWPNCTHRVIAGLSPRQAGGLRDYVVAVRGAAVWFAPGSQEDDSRMLGKFISEMKPGHGVYMGWWPSEDNGLQWIGQYGIQVLASDFLDNASLFGGVAATTTVPPIPPAPPLENKVYVALFISDGDNVQYMQHRLKMTWADPARGSVPIGWTISPLTVDIDPGMLDYYRATATTNDCLVSGPSGAGYTRINYWTNPDYLAAFTKVTESYLQRSGLRVITVWNEITPAVAAAYAANCPSLLGITDQHDTGKAQVQSGLPTLGFARNGSYDSSVAHLLTSITNAARDWNGSAPMFIAVQGNAWDISLVDCVTIARALDKRKFVMIRPDHLFQLYRQQANLATVIVGPAVEQGPWTDLTPPANLSGWTRLPIPLTNHLGRAQWHMDDSGKILICDGDGSHEMLRFNQEFTNCVFHVEYRFTPKPGTNVKYNSGVFIRNSADGAIWHQAQVANNGGYIFGNTLVDGVAKRIKLPLLVPAAKPASEWNSMDVTASGQSISVKLNGEETSMYPTCEVPHGFIALEAEGYRIEFRNLKLSVLP